MLTLHTAGRQTAVTADDLIAGVTKGRIPIESRVQLEDGRWQQVSLWYLEHSQISAPDLGDVADFVADRTVDQIVVADVQRHLGLEREATALDRALQEALDIRISMPEWARIDDMSDRLTDRLEPPPWNPDPAGAIAAEIRLPRQELAIPAWGRPYKLPTMERLHVPEWNDPSQAGLALPPRQDVVWEAQEGDFHSGPDALTELLAQTRKATGTPAKRPQTRQERNRAAKQTRADKRRQLRRKRHDDAIKAADNVRSFEDMRALTKLLKEKVGIPDQKSKPPVDTQEQPAQPQPVQPSPAVEERARSDRTDDLVVTFKAKPEVHQQRRPALKEADQSTTISTEKSGGFFGCFGRLVAVSIIALAALVVQDISLRELAGEIEELTGEARAKPRPQRTGLATSLIATGPKDTLVHVVMAIDFAESASRNQGVALLQGILRHPLATGLPRVTVFPTAGTTPTSRDVRTAIVAADELGCFWPWWRAFGSRPMKQVQRAKLTMRQLKIGLRAANCDMAKWEDHRKNPKTELRARTLSTMAEALQLDTDVPARANFTDLPAVLIKRPKSLRSLLNVATTTVARIEQKQGGDRVKTMEAVAKHMKPEIADRFVHWIVRGERLPTTPLKNIRPPRRVVQAPAAVLKLDKRAPMFGDEKAPVRVVVFCNYTSPFCQRHWRDIQRLQRRHAKKVSVAWLLHPQKASKGTRHPAQREIAALAAHDLLGMFWQTHEWLLRHRKHKFRIDKLHRHLKTRDKTGRKWSHADLIRSYGAAIRTMAQHRKWAGQAGVNGAPYTLVGTHVLRGAVGYKRLESAVLKTIEDLKEAP